MKFIAVTELLVAALLWGFGFIATIWAFESFSATLMTVIRFLGAFLICVPFLLFKPQWRKQLRFENWALAFLPGIFLGATLLLQTLGLRNTTATKSSFITTLYVIFVPFTEIFILKRRLNPLHFVFVFLALLGTAFIINLHDFSELENNLNIGDVLTFLCAMIASLQITWLSKIGSKVESPFAFNLLQSFWSGLVALIVIIPMHDFQMHALTLKGVAGLVSLLFGSTILAFYLQVKAQKVLSASVSSLLCLLESPFATIFAVFILHEKLSNLQLLGAFLIFASTVGASSLDLLAKSPPKAS